jgi:hypothetical protein
VCISVVAEQQRGEAAEAGDRLVVGLAILWAAGVVAVAEAHLRLAVAGAGLRVAVAKAG